jgi:hypothetical protein
LSSGTTGLYDDSVGSTTHQGQLAKGKRAALFQVHFEGNLGDQMETIPLLQVTMIRISLSLLARIMLNYYLIFLSLATAIV